MCLILILTVIKLIVGRSPTPFAAADIDVDIFDMSTTGSSGEDEELMTPELDPGVVIDLTGVSGSEWDNGDDIQVVWDSDWDDEIQFLGIRLGPRVDIDLTV